MSSSTTNTSSQHTPHEDCPSSLQGLSATQLLKTLWGDLLNLTSQELQQAKISNIDTLLDRYVRVRWIKLQQTTLCVFAVRSAGGDEVVYQFPILKRLIPRTYLVPWNEKLQEFDNQQAITGLTKIAGMQDEGVHQVLDVEEINTRCVGGEVLSLEKANGKACVFWVKHFAGSWILGFGSKTAVDPSFCYDLSAPLSGKTSWKTWAEARQNEVANMTMLDVKQREIIKGVAQHTLVKLTEMTEAQIARLIKYLQSGATLCGELEEGGKHVVPTAHRVVYFATSRLSQSGIHLDSPIETATFLDQVGFQRLDALQSTREPFIHLSNQPSSLQLSSSRREGSVRYFLDAQGKVVATMKIKDPHYMFYRKLRNAMDSANATILSILNRLARSLRDPYYQRCLGEAGIPYQFSDMMMRSATKFLCWFTQQAEFGQNFQLAGFMPNQIGLGELMNRWRKAEGESRLGDYDHVVEHPECYELPQDWVTTSQGKGNIAMVVMRGAQGSGKSTLSLALAQAFNQSALQDSITHQASHQATHQTASPNIAHLALPAEQDPLQKKREYQAWLDLAIWPFMRNWLVHHGVLQTDQTIPVTISTPLEWQKVILGKPNVRFPQLLKALSESYQNALELIRQTATQTTDLTDLTDLTNLSSTQPPPLIIINARCNQNSQATERWETWLTDQETVGLSTIRLNASDSLLNERVRLRGRDRDKVLLGEVIQKTNAQVSTGTMPDLELDATLTTEAQVLECLPLIHLALERVRPQWTLSIKKMRTSTLKDSESSR